MSISQNGTIVFIQTDKYSKSDTFDILFYKEGEVIQSVSSGSGGGGMTRIKKANVDWIGNRSVSVCGDCTKYCGNNSYFCDNGICSCISNSEYLEVTEIIIPNQDEEENSFWKNFLIIFLSGIITLILIFVGLKILNYMDKKIELRKEVKNENKEK
jgi:hypothetical protein